MALRTVNDETVWRRLTVAANAAQASAAAAEAAAAHAAAHGGGVGVSVLQYADTAEGVTAATVHQAILAADEDGSNAIFFPAGEYTFDLSDITSDDGTTCLITIPSNFSVRGDGAGSIINMVGLDGGASGDPGRNLFGITSGAEDVTIEGLHIVGENGVGAAGFVFVENNQSSAISFLLTSFATNRCTVRNCIFENLWGFPIHSPGGVVDVDILDNTIFWCANGINVNGNRTRQNGNHFYQSEGFETSGCDNQFDNNILIDCVGVAAISIGGDQVVGAKRHGNQVTNNTVAGMTKAGSQACGITFGNAIVGGLIANNTIAGCTGYGIQLITDLGGALCEHARVVNNVIINNSDNSSSVGAVLLAGTGNHVFEGNTVRNLATTDGGAGTGVETGLGCQLGIVVNCHDTVIRNNILGGTNYGIAYLASTLRHEQSGNSFPGWENPGNPDTISVGPISWGAGCTTVISSEYAFALTDYARYVRVNGSTYTPFIEYANGKHEWGSGAAGLDVSLARLGVAQLGTAAGQTISAGGGTDASAILQATSTTQGFLPPRMTSTQRDAIATPAAGLTIFNTTTTKLETWDGAVWRAAW